MTVKGAIEANKIAKRIFTQKEFDLKRMVNSEESNNKWCKSTRKGDQETCAKAEG